MSVIGSLDDQVEAVLINPLKRRERGSDEEEARDTPSVVPLPPPPASSHEEREAESPWPETRKVDASLPVWLL